jgi:hypothetical protein
VVDSIVSRAINSDSDDDDDNDSLQLKVQEVMQRITNSPQHSAAQSTPDVLQRAQIAMQNVRVYSSLIQYIT